MFDQEMERLKMPPSRLLTITKICGALPLMIGVIIFGLWVWTRSDGLISAGIFTIYGGLASFALGSLSLFSYILAARKSAEFPRPLVWRSALKASALLLSNFPAAFAIVVAAILIETRYTVTIQNQTSSSATDLRIHGGGCDIAIANVSPHDSTSRSFWIQHDDRLEFSLQLNGQERTHIIEGYVTHGQGGSKTVTIDQNEQLSTKCQEAEQDALSNDG